MSDVSLDGTETDLWQKAARHAPITYRWFGRTIPIDKLDQLLGNSREWNDLKHNLLPSDVIWPFSFNHRSLAMRQGYVVIRGGKPVAGIVMVLS